MLNCSFRLFPRFPMMPVIAIFRTTVPRMKYYSPSVVPVPALTWRSNPNPLLHSLREVNERTKEIRKILKNIPLFHL